MDDCRLRELAAQAPCQPVTIAPASIRLSSHPQGVSQVQCWWRHGFRGALYTPPQTPHVVAVHVQDAPRFIQGRDGRCHGAPVHKGDALIVRAGQPTFWYGEGISNLNIALDPAFVQRIALETCGSDPRRVELRDVFSTRDRTLLRLARLCCTELQTGGLGGPLYVEALGTLLALHLLRTYCTQRLVPEAYRGGLSPHHVHRVVEYIHAHLAQPLTLGELAGVLQMSQGHFLRAFRHTMRCTPHQYVLHCRIAQAKALLTTSGMPISAVATRVGFQTHSHFTRLFHTLTGRSPTAYRHEQGVHAALPAPPADAPRGRTVGGDAYETLSPREREILPLIAVGHTNSEMAAILGMSPRTVETHRAHLKQKLSLRTQVDLIRYALQRGIVPLDQ